MIRRFLAWYVWGVYMDLSIAADALLPLLYKLEKPL